MKHKDPSDALGYKWLLKYFKKRKKRKTRDVCKTLTSRPFQMKHLPRSSPHLVYNKTKSFGSTPLPHPLDATAKKIKMAIYIKLTIFKVRKL